MSCCGAIKLAFVVACVLAKSRDSESSGLLPWRPISNGQPDVSELAQAKCQGSFDMNSLDSG